MKKNAAGLFQFLLLPQMKIRSGTAVVQPLGCSQYKAIRVWRIKLFLQLIWQCDKSENSQKNQSDSHSLSIYKCYIQILY